MSLELEGECQIHKYQDRNGNNQTTVNVVVDNLAFTSKNPQQQGGNVHQNAPQQTAPAPAPQNNGSYQQRPQQQRNGYTPGGNGYPAAPAYQQPKADFLNVPEGVDDYPFN